ncbi:MAG: glycosyltransferase family 4 protein [Verrucomicrobia bacterium]|nr:glycosyltransferase family 4 protein [Verrucomicrobiota bacterium]
MKLLVFAHTPPPHHGQSYMVQLMVAGFGGDRRKRARPQAGGPAPESPYGIECYHINTRLSQKLEDIGDFRVGKFILLLGYCLQAIWCRWRYGVTDFYYIPAPGKRSALYRDWVVMMICRPFFKRIILHWHAAGLAKWLERVVGMRHRALTYRLLKRVDLSIVLSKYNRADAEKLFSRQVRIVSNGIPDPCPQFDANIMPRPKARFAARRKLLSGQSLTEEDLKETGGDPQVVKVLYLAHCTREKGVFDTLAAAAIASRRLAEAHAPVSLKFLVTGGFVTAEEEAEFKRIMAEPDMARMVQYFGFVSGDQKHQLMREADLFCFPTYFQNENQPVNLIEAMAFGLPILTTRWRSLPELFPADYPGLVNIRSPEQVAEVMLALMTNESGAGFRDIFLRTFTLDQHLASLAEAFLHIGPENPAAEPAAAVRTSSS